MPNSYWWKEGSLSGIALCVYCATAVWAFSLFNTCRNRSQRWQLMAICVFTLGQALRVFVEPTIDQTLLQNWASKWFNLGLALVSVVTLLLAIRSRQTDETAAHQLQNRKTTEIETASSAPVPVASTLAQLSSAPIRLAPPIGRDRRRRLRVPLKRPVRVEVLGADHQEVAGETVDFSGDGVGLLLETPIPTDCMVVVWSEEGLMLGEVRNWQSVLGGFRVGIRIDQFLAPRGENEGEDQESDAHNSRTAS